MNELRKKYPSITILGSGIMGLLTAWKLMREGAGVTIIDQDAGHSRSATSFYAGGMLSPVSELEKADHIIHSLGMRSIELWQEILDDLGAPELLERRGSLIVAHERDMPLLKRFAEKIRAAGFSDEIASLGADEIAALEPALKNRFSFGYFIEKEAHLSPRDILALLRSKLVERGATFITGQQLAWQESGFKMDHHADMTIDCRGIGAQDRFSDLRGVKGEMVIVKTADISLSRPVRMIHPRYPLYIVPRAGREFMVGATEIETGDMDAVKVRSALELLSALYAVHPGFGEADILELGTHLRPAFSDNAPRILHEGNQMAINGLYRHGYLISPALAYDASDILAGDGKTQEDNQVA